MFLYNWEKPQTGLDLYLNINVHLVQVKIQLSINAVPILVPRVYDVFKYSEIELYSSPQYPQTIFVIADTVVSSRPWRLGHCYCPLIYCAIYIIFQVIYLVGAGGVDEVS